MIPSHNRIGRPHPARLALATQSPLPKPKAHRTGRPRPLHPPRLPFPTPKRRASSRRAASLRAWLVSVRGKVPGFVVVGAVINLVGSLVAKREKAASLMVISHVLDTSDIASSEGKPLQHVITVLYSPYPKSTRIHSTYPILSYSTIPHITPPPPPPLPIASFPKYTLPPSPVFRQSVPPSSKAPSTTMTNEKAPHLHSDV